MFKKFTVAFIALLFVVAALSACTADTKTLVVFSDVPVIVPVPTSDGQSGTTGERLFYSGMLRNSENEGIGELIGQLTTFSVIVNDVPEIDRFRKLVFNMSQGQIYVQGASQYINSEAPRFAEDGDSTTAIILGGTGDYVGVQGTVTSKQNEDGTYQHTFVFLG